MFQIRKAGLPVQPTSIVKIKAVADSFRSHIEKWCGPYGTFCPIVNALETLGKEPFEDLGFAVLEDNDPNMADKWAYTDPTGKCIYLSETVYQKACQNNPQARFTIAHELGHLLLGHKVDVIFARQNCDTKIPCYRDSEWQADTFAAQLLMPTELAQGKTTNELEQLFGVSASAAIARGDRLKKHEI